MRAPGKRERREKRSAVLLSGSSNPLPHPLGPQLGVGGNGLAGRSNRRVKIHHDRELYKQRNCIERMFGRLKINRSIATRYDQLANSFLGMVHIATARYWLKFVHAA